MPTPAERTNDGKGKASGGDKGVSNFFLNSLDIILLILPYDPVILTRKLTFSVKNATTIGGPMAKIGNRN